MQVRWLQFSVNYNKINSQMHLIFVYHTSWDILHKIFHLILTKITRRTLFSNLHFSRGEIQLKIMKLDLIFSSSIHRVQRIKAEHIFCNAVALAHLNATNECNARAVYKQYHVVDNSFFLHFIKLTYLLKPLLIFFWNGSCALVQECI